MKEYSFERLEVWKLARRLTNHIYSISRNFPDEEKFGITSQIRRASVSIGSNIAEGTSRKSRIEKQRFLEISYGSTLEVLNLLLIAHDQQFIKEADVLQLRSIVEELTNKLYKLKETIQ
ncbi:MAG: four helix bundle protein [Saprospiraceae bacterium]|nr:four helix bundle protein [Saprospiraceae bacterium]MCB9222440.1 four helix bundle protein [Ignavibacteria bacterium]